MFADLAYLWVILAALRGARVAAADSCFNVGYAPAGECNVDPRASEFLQAVVIQDHMNASCDSSVVFKLNAQYVDNRGKSRSADAIAPVTIDPAFTGTMTFNFPVALATIGEVKPVTLGLSARPTGKGDELTASFEYVQRHSPTIVYTATVISTIMASTTSTTTKTVIATESTTSTPKHRSTITQFGIKTLSHSPCTSSTTIHITPSPMVKLSTSTTTISATATCQSTSLAIAKAPLRFKRGVEYSTPYCGSPVTTIIPKSTISIKTTVISTEVVTELYTSKTIETHTAPAVTIYKRITSTQLAVASACNIHTAWERKERDTKSVVITETQTKWATQKGVSLPACAPAVTARIVTFGTSVDLPPIAQETAPSKSPIETSAASSAPPKVDLKPRDDAGNIKAHLLSTPTHTTSSPHKSTDDNFSDRKTIHVNSHTHTHTYTHPHTRPIHFHEARANSTASALLSLSQLKSDITTPPKVHVATTTTVTHVKRETTTIPTTVLAPARASESAIVGPNFANFLQGWEWSF
ncbi:hypothetical protein EJ08DRAFT_730650 [Tothia fuscella]|uniref:Uncharacterized protein n=1 Tax=Tothia fuscella TaxID=1048955 RepID=A0A9P4NXV7_9PEZI|nr:hypothetical protein EJ08DRAFT_730650 [Tothia fuscella]